MAGNRASGMVGALVTELRTGRRLSTRKLAERAGVNRSALAKWEADLDSPPLDAVIKLAAALEVSVHVFLPPDPVSLSKPAWQTVASRLELTYDEALRLQSRLADAGIAETASLHEAAIAWLRDRGVLQ